MTDTAPTIVEDLCGEKKGWLFKLANAGFSLNPWAKRWIVLESSGLVRYFKNETDLEPRGQFSLLGARIHQLLPSEAKGRENAFIVDDERRSYILAAGTPEETYEWLAVFKSHNSNMNLGEFARPGQEVQILMEGELTKMGGAIKTWRRRYFKLTEAKLSYYKKADDDEPLGEINLLAGGTVDLCSLDSYGRDNCFSIISASISDEKDKRKYVMAADSMPELEQWLAQLESVCSKKRESIRYMSQLRDSTLDPRTHFRQSNMNAALDDNSNKNNNTSHNNNNTDNNNHDHSGISNNNNTNNDTNNDRNNNNGNSNGHNNDDQKNRGDGKNEADRDIPIRSASKSILGHHHSHDADGKQLKNYTHSRQRAGWLKKLGGLVENNWQKRFFVLSDGYLWYFKKEEHASHQGKNRGKKPRGDIDIVGARILKESIEAYNQPFTFSIIPATCSSRRGGQRSSHRSKKYVLVADSMQAMNEWISRLRAIAGDNDQNGDVQHLIGDKLEPHGSGDEAEDSDGDDSNNHNNNNNKNDHKTSNNSNDNNHRSNNSYSQSRHHRSACELGSGRNNDNNNTNTNNTTTNNNSNNDNYSKNVSRASSRSVSQNTDQKEHAGDKITPSSEHCDPNSVLEGWLKKKGTGVGTHAWRVRYFILTPKAIKWYTQEPRKPGALVKKLQGEVELAGCTIDVKDMAADSAGALLHDVMDNVVHAVGFDSNNHNSNNHNNNHSINNDDHHHNNNHNNTNGNNHPYYQQDGTSSSSSGYNLQSNSSHHHHHTYHCFNITPQRGHKSYLCKAYESAIRDIWAKTLSEQIQKNKLKIKKDSIKEGYLLRLNYHRDDEWVRQYVILDKKNMLRAYASHARLEKVENTISLLNAGIQMLSRDEYGRPCCFLLSTDNSNPQNLSGGDSEWVCAAKDRKDLESWVDTIMMLEEPEPSSDDDKNNNNNNNNNNNKNNNNTNENSLTIIENDAGFDNFLRLDMNRRLRDEERARAQQNDDDDSDADSIDSDFGVRVPR